MNNLNSILIEGIVFDGPVYDINVCYFYITSSHMYKHANVDEPVKEDVTIEIYAYGKLGEMCSKRLAKNGKCRVIGRLAYNRGTGKHYISAENVEIPTDEDSDE